MAYAAVISLKHTIERLIDAISPQITESAYQELGFLEDVLTKLDDSSNSSPNRCSIDALDAEIREAVYKLEDVLESYAFNLPPSQGLDKEGVEREIDSFLKTAKKLEGEYLSELDNPNSLPEEEEDAAVSPTYDLGGNKSTMVGLLDQFEQIRNELLDWQPRLKIISLYGMAGIGKTLLSRKIYQLPSIVQDFDIHVCVSLGPNYQIRRVLMDIAAQIDRKPIKLYMEENENKLGDRIFKSLYGRKYFIILDDIWSTRVWDYLKMLFPDQKQGSRVLLITRQEEVAKYAMTSIAYQMRFLNQEESWNLLCEGVFGGKPFPPELERVGRKIAENCEGLPLVIIVVASILREHEQTEEYWKKVADQRTTTFPDAYDKISKVLLSSYVYLPQYLKACFLYMTVFPQKSEIPLPKLINLWTVEDFLKPNMSQALDDFAMKCVMKLVSQSLVIVCKNSANCIIKTCKLHSAYWYLCVKEARKNKFLHVLNNSRDVSEDETGSQRRLSIQNNILFGIKEVYNSMAANLTARSLLCTGEDHQYPVPICWNLVLLKVLDALAIRFYEFPNEVLKLLQLRYLALTLNGELPSSTSNLRNLQSLSVRQYHNIKMLRDSTHDVQEQKGLKLFTDPTCLPMEIWDIQELRHLRIMGSNLPNPSDGALLPNLSTLYLNAHSCTKDVFRSIPKLKKLGIKIELQPDGAETLSCLEYTGLFDGLESLKCVVVNPRMRSQVVAPPDHLSNLPRGLRELSLKGMGYSWEFMRAIGSLPNLEVLKLRCCAFQGAELETGGGEFQRLEFLLLEDIDLVHWTTEDDDCFPLLQRLIMRRCFKLKEIPSQIGAIRTLKSIELVDCSRSVVGCVQQIQKDEEYYGISTFQVLITSTWNL